jgi:hypothetical protein
MSDDTRTPRADSTLGATATVRTENPGRDQVASGRTEVGEPDYRRDPPHVTRNDQDAPLQKEQDRPDEIAAIPPNASGRDRVSVDEAAQPTDPTSAYGRRPAENKNIPPE